MNNKYVQYWKVVSPLGNKKKNIEQGVGGRSESVRMEGRLQY